jgi:hypothetical protein
LAIEGILRLVTIVQPASLADLEAAAMTTILDAIPGAYERAQEGLREIAEGRGIKLEDL